MHLDNPGFNWAEFETSIFDEVYRASFKELFFPNVVFHV